MRFEIHSLDKLETLKEQGGSYRVHVDLGFKSFLLCRSQWWRLGWRGSTQLAQDSRLLVWVFVFTSPK